MDKYLADHVGFITCNCGKMFDDIEKMAEHGPECEAMPHIG